MDCQEFGEDNILRWEEEALGWELYDYSIFNPDEECGYYYQDMVREAPVRSSRIRLTAARNDQSQRYATKSDSYLPSAMFGSRIIELNIWLHHVVDWR